MRVRFCFVHQSLVGVVVSAVLAASACAQNGGQVSTIRLASAVEPVNDNSRSLQSVQDPPPAMQDSAAPAPNGEDEQATQLHPQQRPVPHMPAEIRQPRMPAGLYPSQAARETLNQLPGPPPVESAPRAQVAVRRGGKPFQSLQPQQAISPYLYLMSGGSSTNAMTNYFAFVKPQLDQQDAARQQQKEIQQLRTQLQKVSTGGGKPVTPSSPSTAAHFMDTAQFYHGLQR